MTLLAIVDLVLFVALAVNVLYLTIFSIASLFKSRFRPLPTPPSRRFVVLIPAYKEDVVINACVDSCLGQNYPKELYDLAVISDRMDEQTNLSLEKLPLRLFRVNFENSTKSKALNLAMSLLDDRYDIAVVLDADNIVLPDFLSRINDAFAVSGVEIVQAHRCAKNTNTNLAVLDALSEEINNNIFRKGHCNLGLSAALIGSGMAFDYHLFKSTMLSIDAIGGFDRALELNLLSRNKRIYYLAQVDVFDEKVQHSADFSSQRRRWLSAQFHYLGVAFTLLRAAIVQRHYDFCDKTFQQMSMPRLILLGLIFMLALAASLIDVAMAAKWWALFLALTLALVLATPRRLMTRGLVVAVVRVPYYFGVMAMNLFKLKGANKRFIHTSHGVANDRK